jgi:hypothetical protein
MFLGLPVLSACCNTPVATGGCGWRLIEAHGDTDSL